MIPLLWIDLETTGLDPEDDLVLEIEARMTDESLVETARFHTVIHYPEDAYNMNFMDPKVREFHTKNGLLDEVAASQVSLEAARKEFTNWLYSLFTLGEKRPLAGSNPSFDRGFLAMHFLEATAFLHYRSFDMNTVYYFLEADKDKKKGLNKHRTTFDLDYDIDMLRQFRARVGL